MVLFGLILVNFGPLKIFPTINPPKSDAAHVNKTRKIKIFKWKKDDNIKKYVQKVKI